MIQKVENVFYSLIIIRIIIMKVVFFHQILPMDMGIIAILKTLYKTYLSRNKNICLKNNVKFNVTVFDAMYILVGKMLKSQL